MPLLASASARASWVPSYQALLLSSTTPLPNARSQGSTTGTTTLCLTSRAWLGWHGQRRPRPCCLLRLTASNDCLAPSPPPLCVVTIDNSPQGPQARVPPSQAPSKAPTSPTNLCGPATLTCHCPSCHCPPVLIHDHCDMELDISLGRQWAYGRTCVRACGLAGVTVRAACGPGRAGVRACGCSFFERAVLSG